MAVTEWVRVREIWCERIGGPAYLMEQRIYPDEILPDTAPYQVVARKCSAGIECNMDGSRCKWAYTNPNFDPFE